MVKARGKLKNKSCRDVRGKKRVRVEFDIPFRDINNEEIGDKDFMRWLDIMVGTEISVDIGNVEGLENEDME